MTDSPSIVSKNLAIEQSGGAGHPAARIAEVLGLDARSVRRTLAGLAPAGSALSNGAKAATYTVESLPRRYRDDLEEIARSRGYASADALLTRQGPRWSHPIPFAEIHPEEIVRAQKRAVALAPWVRQYSSGAAPVAEVIKEAMIAHRHVLGYDLSAKALGMMMRRAIGLDAGWLEFDRPELYLPEHPKRFEPRCGELLGEFDQVGIYLETINPAAPTLADRAAVWSAMCTSLQMLLEAGEPMAKSRSRLIEHVFARAPWLSRSKASLAKCFDTKWDRYLSGDRSLKDRRPVRSGRRRQVPLTKEDEHKLIAHGLTSGSLAAAWRTLHGQGELSAGVVAGYTSNSASKTYVPAHVRKLITPQIGRLQDLHHGPRRAKLNGAYVSRDWSKVFPGDWYQGDDCTLPVYYWEHGPDGVPRALRGQCLLMIDVRSLRTLAFALHSANHYNARVIRGLILKTHDSYGLPRRGFYFERGIWKSSRLVTGGESGTNGHRSDETPMEETEAGMKDFGVEFRHATLPRGKVVERVLGILQSSMEGEPGYCGRNEQVEKFERLQKNLLAARRGKLRFSDFLLHRDEWVERLAEICDAYNQERQDGQLLRGLSPCDFWSQRFDFEKPLIRLADGLRHVLANHRRPLKVTSNGVCVQIGKERHWFRNESTGALRGQVVQVYFDPEDLSSVWIRPSGDTSTAIVVPRAELPSAMDATDEEIAAAIAQCASHNQADRTLYRAIAPHFPPRSRPHFRQNLVSPEFIEQTRAIQDQQADARAALETRDKERRQLQRYVKRLGQLPDADVVSPARQLSALKLLDEANHEE